ncbi:unnamed protein product [Brachionus calyciflorus]|uniref:Uncharacterized protein n=1 Tax=Brachionus calyciflorus TaxID=104777 RepID=A0A814K0Q7_9BILA|nr:unnamed protein product [Brachionus calyciflorus]
MPRLPKEISESSLNLDRFCMTSYSKEFLLFDTVDIDRKIAFASKIQLEILSKSTKWHINGTFKSCPNLYYQFIQFYQFEDYIKLIETKSKFIEKFNTIVYSTLTQWPLHNEIDDFLDVIWSLYQFKDENSSENSRKTENEVKNGCKKARKTSSSDMVAQN